jgi:competence protein ComEA
MSGRLTVMALGLALVGGVLVVKESFFFRQWQSAPPDTVVQVEGEVPNPGWYELESATVHDALRAAGASTEGVENHPLQSGRRLAVAGTDVQVGPSGKELVVGVPLDLNMAGAADLVILPGIGPTRAEAIVQHRQSDPFRSVEDLLQVHGIGPKTLEKLRPFVHVGP